MDARIRPFGPADQNRVIQMLAASDPWRRLGYTAEDWERVFSSGLQGRDATVIEAEGRVCGLALVRQRFLLGDYLELLAVAPDAQGGGLGSLLLRHLETEVFARVKNLFVCVSDFNIGARRFYARHGFHEIGAIPNFLIPNAAEILLRKTIGPIRDGQR